MEKVIIEIEAKTGKAEKGIENVDKSLQDVADSLQKVNKEFTETNKDTVEGLDKTKKGLKGVEEGSKKTSLGVKGIGTALKAAGIGLALAAFSKLAEVFNKNQKVADAFGTAFEVVSIALNDFVNFLIDNTGGVVKFFKGIFEDPLGALKEFADAFRKNIQERFESYLDTLGFLASAVKKVFSGDFTGALEDVKNAGKESLDVLTGVNDTFDKGTKVIKDVVKATTDYAKETLKAAQSNVELEKSARLAEAANQGLIEQYDIQAEKLRQVRDDDSKSIEERIKANEELGKVLEEQQEVMQKNAAIRVAQAAAELSKNKDNVDLQVAYQEALNEQAGIEAQITGFKSEQLVNEIALKREQLELNTQQKESDAELELQRQLFNANLIQDIDAKEAKLKEINDAEEVRKRAELETTLANAKAGTQAYVDAKIALNEFNEEERQKDLQRDVDAKLQKQEVLNQIDDAIAVTEEEKEALRVEREIEATTKRYDRLIEQAKKFGLDTVELEKKKAAALDGINKSTSKNAIDWEKSTKDEKMAIASEGLNTLTSVLGEESAAGKAAAIGSAIISTYESANNAFNSLSGIPIVGPALGAVAAAGAVASGIANVKSIKSTPTYGGKSVASPSVSAPSAPSLPPAFNVVGSSNASQLSDAIANSTNSRNEKTQEVAEQTSSTPIKTYVVASDVTTAQSLDRNIVDNASL